MRVICIDNESGGKQFNLTIGKIYDVYSSSTETILNHNSYFIMNDIGKLVDYASFRFKTLDEHRDRVINSLGIE